MPVARIPADLSLPHVGWLCAQVGWHTCLDREDTTIRVHRDFSRKFRGGGGRSIEMHTLDLTIV